MINLDNYIAYYIDYIDNNLSEEHTIALMSFLDDNPNLKAEVSGLEDMFLTPDVNDTFSGEIYTDKLSLKQTPELPRINLTNADDYIIRDLEHDLSASEQTELSELTNRHPKLKKDAALLEATKLFPNLKQRANKAPLFQLSNGLSFEEACIASIEGQLSKKDQQELTSFLTEHPSTDKILAEYKQTILSPTIVMYGNKTDLKQSIGPKKIIPLWAKRAAALAAILTIGYIAINLSDTSSSGSSNYAQRSNTIVPVIDYNYLANDNSIDSLLNARYNHNLEKTNTIEEGSSPQNTTSILQRSPKFAQSDNKKAPEHTPTDSSSLTLPKLVDEKPDHLIAQAPTLDSNRVFSKDTLNKSKPLPIVPKLITSNSGLIAQKNTEKERKTAPVGRTLDIKETLAKLISHKTNDDVNKIYETDINYAAVNSIAKIVGTSSDYEKTETDNRKVTTFSIGGIQFYKSKNK